MATMQVVRRGEVVTFESPFTNDEALEKLRSLTTKSDFARELVAKAAKGLSDRQWAWVHKIVVDTSNPRPSGVDVDLSGVIKLFAHAKQHLNRPAIVLRTATKEIKLSLASENSKHPGAVYVASGTWGGPYYGRIEPNGTLVPGRDLCDEVRELLRELADKPAETAAKHGKLTGHCCFCARRLSDERSTQVGYGKVCADHFGMPWGSLRGRNAPFGAFGRGCAR